MPASAQQVRLAVTASGEWLLLLALAWGVSLSRRLRALACRLWPELTALLGALGWYLAGPSAVPLLLLALGVGGRLLLVGGGLRRVLARRKRAQALSGNGARA